jgi:hypothetical protein
MERRSDLGGLSSTSQYVIIRLHLDYVIQSKTT